MCLYLSPRLHIISTIVLFCKKRCVLSFKLSQLQNSKKKNEICKDFSEYFSEKFEFSSKTRSLNLFLYNFMAGATQNDCFSVGAHRADLTVFGDMRFVHYVDKMGILLTI